MFILTSAISGIFGLVFLAIWLLLSIFTVISVLRNRGHQLNVYDKILWMLLIIVVPIVGSLIYIIWKSARKPEA
jgi:hypothetical protein